VFQKNLIHDAGRFPGPGLGTSRWRPGHQGAGSATASMNFTRSAFPSYIKREAQRHESFFTICILAFQLRAYHCPSAFLLANGRCANPFINLYY
jgi:hypothetical protein